LKRRAFITLLGGAAVAWPLAVRAQQAAKTARIGFLGADTQSGVESRLERFRAGLRDLGYVEGDNVFIDFRWAEGNYARLVEFAAELIHLKVDLLATYGTPGTVAARQATTTVPIVMIVSGDAVATGIVASLARPGGNVTGSTFFGPELNAKGLEVLKEALPSASRIATLFNPGNSVNAPVLQAMVRTASALKLELQPFEARTPDDFQSVFLKMIETGPDAIAITDDTLSGRPTSGGQSRPDRRRDTRRARVPLQGFTPSTTHGGHPASRGARGSAPRSGSDTVESR